MIHVHKPHAPAIHTITPKCHRLHPRNQWEVSLLFFHCCHCRGHSFSGELKTTKSNKKYTRIIFNHNCCILDMCITESHMDNICIRSISYIHENGIKIKSMQRSILCIMHSLSLHNFTIIKKL